MHLCGICNQEYSVALLVVVHIQKRSKSSHEERKNLDIVMPMCKLGCDELYEWAEKYNLDINEIVLNKIKRNGEKYPVEKARGTAKKYDEKYNYLANTQLDNF